MVVDHRAYLGSAGLYFAAAGLLWRPGRVALVLVLLAGLSARSVHYQWVLADPVRAWQHAAGHAPRSAEARRALGDAYARAGDPRAEAQLRRSVDLDPRDPRGWANLGAFLAERGRLDEAAEATRAAARTAPGDARIRDNLGMLLLALGREGEALVELEAAVAGQPVLAQPRITLAALLLRRGHRQRAADLIAEAKRLEVDPADARRLLHLERQLGAP
jgi:Flp pilus assembly protein TadD